MATSKELLERAAASAKAAREIAEKADNEKREMTEDERSEFTRKFNEAVEIKKQADTKKGDEDVIAQAKAMAEEIGLTLPTDAEVEGVIAGDLGKAPVGRVPLEKQVVESAQFKALMKGFNGHIPDRSRVQSDPIAVKSLFTGASSTSAGAFVTAEDSGILEVLGRRALTLRDLVSVRRTGSDTIEFVRQTSHTNNAAETPEATTTAEIGGEVTTALAGLKPEGAWAYERVSTSVKTIAEWVPATKRALADVAQLEGLIRDELVADLKEREDNQILNGNGSGENLEGILETDNIQTQAFTMDIFATTRKAITKVRKIGRVNPNGFLMNPEDVEKIDLARENGSSGAYFGNGPFALGPRTLWGIPVVESEIVPEATAVLGDFKKAVLWDREQATVTISDSHADFFTRNLVAVLAEERVAFGVTRPKAFVEIATAGS